MFTRQPSLLHSGYISLFVCLLDYECSPDNPEVYYMVLYELHFSYPYIYDVSIASKEEAEHTVHLQQVFERFKEYGIVVNPNKCDLGVSSLHFLGHVVDKNGISALDSKLSAVRIFPQLETPHKLRVLRVDKLLPPFYPPLCSGILTFKHF
uniref:Reverse transcriptase domain-containing protein n=1 Tax=Amphimedon queenslandica TaxID=400682 RepID=A0A1X7TDB9_AMPQE